MTDLGGSAEPVAPPSVSENQATRALALALADGFRAKGLNTVDAAAALIREHDELVEENARLTAEALARAPQGDPPEPPRAHHCPTCGAFPVDVPAPQGDAASPDGELERLRALLNTPEIEDFDKAVPLEAAHQVQRWGVPHDDGKNPEDWFWLVGYLAGKALAALKAGDREKAKHHCISTAAALRNWHAHIRSGVTVMRPGIEVPALRGGASSSGSAPAGSPPHDPPREPTHYAVGPRWPIGGPYPCGREAEERGAAHCSTVAWGVDCVKCLRALVERGAAPAPPPPDDFAQFATDARTELDRADEKWPDGDVYLRLAALAGEVGELAEGVIKQRAPVELRAEAVQVAVTAYRVARVLFAGVRVGASAPTPEPEPLRAALTKIANWMPTRLPHTQGEAEAFHAVREYAETVVRGVGSPQPAPDVTWRKLLWLRHGCPIHTLYGDDGEMQCGICGIDFLRLSAAEIETYWRNASLRQLAGASPQPPREETK